MVNVTLKYDVRCAHQVLDELRPRFQAARGTLRERRRKVEGINTSMLPFPPGVTQLCRVTNWYIHSIVRMYCVAV